MNGKTKILNPRNKAIKLYIMHKNIRNIIDINRSIDIYKL